MCPPLGATPWLVLFVGPSPQGRACPGVKVVGPGLVCRTARSLRDGGYVLSVPSGSSAVVVAGVLYEFRGFRLMFRVNAATILCCLGAPQGVRPPVEQDGSGSQQSIEYSVGRSDMRCVRPHRGEDRSPTTSLCRQSGCGGVPPRRTGEGHRPVHCGEVSQSPPRSLISYWSLPPLTFLSLRVASHGDLPPPHTLRFASLR